MVATTKTETANKTEQTKQTEQKYSKARLMASEAYKKHRDLIGVILEDNKSYTREEVNKKIDGYLKKEVK